MSPLIKAYTSELRAALLRGDLDAELGEIAREAERLGATADYDCFARVNSPGEVCDLFAAGMARAAAEDTTIEHEADPYGGVRYLYERHVPPGAAVAHLTGALRGVVDVLKAYSALRPAFERSEFTSLLDSLASVARSQGLECYGWIDLVKAPGLGRDRYITYIVEQAQKAQALLEPVAFLRKELEQTIADLKPKSALRAWIDTRRAEAARDRERHQAERRARSEQK